MARTKSKSKNSVSTRGVKSPSSSEQIVANVYTDKKGYKITLNFLDKIWEQSIEMQKAPYLIIAIKRNEKEIFSLECQISLKSKGH